MMRLGNRQLDHLAFIYKSASVAGLRHLAILPNPTFDNVMLKKILLGALLSASFSAAHAGVQAWALEYTGLQYGETLTYQGSYGSSWAYNSPVAKTHVYFEAEDKNHDGIYSANELRALTVQGNSFVNCSGDRQCSSPYFSFNPSKNQLAINLYAVSSHPNGDANIEQYLSYSWGSSYYSNKFTNFDHELDAWRSTNNTTVFTITPVPEPETWGMMVAGLAALGAYARRRKQ